MLMTKTCFSGRSPRSVNIIFGQRDLGLRWYPPHGTTVQKKLRRLPEQISRFDHPGIIMRCRVCNFPSTWGSFGGENKHNCGTHLDHEAFAKTGSIDKFIQKPRTHGTRLMSFSAYTMTSGNCDMIPSTSTIFLWGHGGACPLSIFCVGPRGCMPPIHFFL